MSAVAHFFVVVGGSEIHERTAHFFIDIYINADFEELYRLMTGKPLKEIDEVIIAICTLCRDHEKAGFIEGVKVGIRLTKDVSIS